MDSTETPGKTLEATLDFPLPTDGLQNPPLSSPSLPPLSENAGEGGDQKDAKPSISETPSSGSSPSSGPVSDREKKFRRAERFGMPVQLSEQEKRSSRAERFGTTPALVGKIEVGNEEEEKRKARAKRFGPVGKSPDNEEMKKARLEGLATDAKSVTPEEEEKRKARTLRFAGASMGASEVNGKANSEVTAAVAETSEA